MTIRSFGELATLVGDVRELLPRPPFRKRKRGDFSSMKSTLRRNGQLIKGITIVFLAFGLMSNAAKASAIDPSAFGPSAVTSTFDSLGPLSPSGGPWVIDGNTYSGTNGLYYSYNNAYSPIYYISGGLDIGYIDVQLGADAALVGGYFGVPLYTGFPGAKVQFLDNADHVLGEVDVSDYSANGGFLFAGWMTTGPLIHSVRVYDTVYDGIASGIDSLTTQVAATPIATTLPLFTSGLGLLGLLGWRARRRA